MPFGKYKDFDDCVRKNSDKENPKAYCGKIKAAVEGESMPDLQDWKARTHISTPVSFSAFEEVDGKMMASVRILRSGKSKNRRNYPPHVVKEAVDRGIFNGIRMFINHDRKNPDPVARSLSEMVSAIESTSFDTAENAMNGRVEFFSRDFFDYAQRAKDYMGVSINAVVKGTRQLVAGEVHEEVTGWNQARSVDWVTFPAAGGAILAFEDEDDAPMIDWTKVTAAELKANNKEVFEAIVAEAKAEAAAEDPDPEPDPPEQGKISVTQESINKMIADGVAAALEAQSKAAKERADRQKTAGDQIRSSFEKAGLPPRTRARVLASFEGVETFDEAAVAEAIKSAKEELEAAGAGPIIHGVGPSGTSGEGGTPEKPFSIHESVRSSFGVSTKKDPKEGTK